MKLRFALALSIAALLAAGCGSDDTDTKSSTQAKDKDRTLVVYSGREEELAKPLYAAFEKKTGIKLEVKYAESPAMAALLMEEKGKSPADVFYSQDAGSIGAVSDLLTELPAETLDKVDTKFRDADGNWIGVTARARTLVYNTDELDEKDLPTSVADLNDARWKGKIGVAPTNASFEAFISGMRLTKGEETTKSFLEGLVKNDAREYPKNGAIVDAVANGEVQVGLVNHYYLYEKLESDPKAPIANHYFEPGDIGNMINVSAVGVLKAGKNSAEAQEFVDFLLTEGQRFIVEDAPEREYPVANGFDTNSERYKELTPLDQLNAPVVNLSALGAELEPSVKLITESGLRG